MPELEPTTAGEGTPVLTIRSHDGRRLPPIVAHGAWGSVSPREVVAHLYVEYHRIPSTLEVADDGHVLVSSQEVEEVTREIVATLLVSADAAEHIAGVLTRAASALREATAASTKEEGEEE